MSCVTLEGLTTIATAQARAGDIDGARATLAEAVREADGQFGGAASMWGLWLVGHTQIQCDLKDEARATLRRAMRAVPGVAGDYDRDDHTVRALAGIAADQAALGDRDEARQTVDRLLEFSRKFFESTRVARARSPEAPLIPKLRSAEAPQIARALAAVGDFDAAFAWADTDHEAEVLGAIAETASQALGREEARRFVREAAGRLARIKWADETPFGLTNLAEAQARLGDIDGARRSAGSIGEGPTRVADDITGGQVYAFGRVATVQRLAGDLTGARETLRLAFRSIREHPRMQRRDGRYFEVATEQIASGDIEGATRSVEAIEKDRGEALAALARAYAALGDDAAARTAFARALIDARRTAQNPPGPDPVLAKFRLPGF